MKHEFEKYFPLPWKAQCRGTWEYINAENGKGCNICIIPATNFEPKKAARQYLVQCANFMPEAVTVIKNLKEVLLDCTDTYNAGALSAIRDAMKNADTFLIKLEGGVKDDN